MTDQHFRQMVDQLIYFHGGPAKLKEILPPSKTGAPSCADKGASSVCRKDRVYLTTNFEMAMTCAALQPGELGMVYRVKPVGDVSPDPDYSGAFSFESIQCESAEIVAVMPVKKKHLAKIRRLTKDPRFVNAQSATFPTYFRIR